MGIFDTILLIILAGFVFYGLFFGFIRTLGSLFGIIGGVLLANYFYLEAFGLAKNLLFGYDKTGKVICFFLIFTIANRLICFGFALLNKALDVISIIPFVKTINKLGGAIFGLIEGGVILGLVFYYVDAFHLVSKATSPFVANSKIIPYTVKYAQIFLKFLPNIIAKIKGWMWAIKS